MVSKSSTANAAGLSIVYMALTASVAVCLWSPSHRPAAASEPLAYSYVRHL